MNHISSLKVLCAALFFSTLLVGAVTGCSSSGAPTSNPEGRRLGSYGVTAVVPADWHQVPLRRLPGAIVPLQVASFPVDGAVQTICDPHSIVRQIPAGGALLQILQDGGSYSRRLHLPGSISSPGPASDYKPLARPFHLGPPRSYECGGAYNVFFRMGSHRNDMHILQLRVWTTPGGVSQDVRRQIETLMDSLRVSSY